MAQVSVQNLSFTYPDANELTLDDISFEIEQGQFVVLFGKTACGKTTLLRHLKPALVPHGTQLGSVQFKGMPLAQMDARSAVSNIGFVMQDPDAQLVTDTVWHEMAFGLENLGTDPQTMRLRVAEVASYFGMQHWFNASVAELSGGQKQLLALASILAMHPEVLILDEPTSQLDPISAAEFLATVRKVNEEFSTTIILSEHRLEEVYAAADRVLAMDAGSLVAQGSPREVAKQLLETRSDLALCLPTAARVAWQVEQKQGHTSVQSREESVPHIQLPLSIQEGRQWLQERGVSPVGQGTAAPTSQLNASSVVIEVKDVWVRYERDAPDVLKGASLAIPEQSTFALVGANGVGKSTLLKIFCGAQKPLRGSIKLFGKKLGQWKRTDLFAGTIALLPQEPITLFVKKTVREELEEMLPNEPIDTQVRDQVQRVSELCAIEHLYAMHPLDLSGGEAQRVALAKVLIRKPRILLLDEPTKGIDAVYKQTLAELFKQLKAEGTTIVLASHDLEFCARYADEVALLFDGSIAAQGTPQDFFTLASYYTTAANRISRGSFARAVVEEDIVRVCRNQT